MKAITEAVVTHLNAPPEAVRSEEHTSELQSQSNLVCRLLLEKKIKFLALGSDHLRDIVAMDIHVADADVVPLQGQTDGQVRGYRALAHPFLVAHHQHLILDLPHPLRDEPTTMSFLVLLAGLVLVANGAGPQIGAGIPASGPRMLDHIQLPRHFFSS